MKDLKTINVVILSEAKDLTHKEMEEKDMKEPMDRKIEKKRGVRAAFTTKALPWWGGAVFIGLVLWLVFRDSSSTLRISASTQIPSPQPM